MKRNLEFKLLASIFGLALACAVPAFAQSASSSFHAAGESMENAGTSTGHAVEHAWHGTKTAVKDTDITAKVKTSLHDDSLTKDRDIHVKTVDGVVTLRGDVPTMAVSDRAEKVAAETSGVRSVRNHLHVDSAHATD
jgi:osmotically-inducible protein OsmY